MKEKPTELDVAAALSYGLMIGVFFGLVAGLFAANRATNSWWERATVSKGFAVYAVENGWPVWKWRE